MPSLPNFGQEVVKTGLTESPLQSGKGHYNHQPFEKEGILAWRI
jgi:hypothetical protein